MKFVTSAYKKKLMEQKKWEIQEQLEEEREQRDDVTKTGMSGYVSVWSWGDFAISVERTREPFLIWFDVLLCMICQVTPERLKPHLC